MSLPDKNKILNQLNLFRSRPNLMLKLLQDRKNFINKGNLLFSPNHPNKSIRTKEGTLPVNELIAEFYNQISLKSLKQNVFLSQCAHFVAERYKRENTEQTIFIQGISKDIRNKISANTQFHFKSGIRCIIGVGFNDNNQPLLSILIDDGDKQRRKRKIIMSNNFQYCGASSVALADPSLRCAVYLLANDVEELGNNI